MHRVRGAIVVPVMVGLLTAGAVAACGSTTASVTASATGTSRSTASPPVPGTPSSPAPGTASAGMSSVSTPAASPSAAFPGIWDITSWQAYRAAQASVMQGHQPWLLDPESVVRAWAASQWTTVPAVRQIAADTFQLTKPGTNVIYTVRGTRPDPNSAAPIWVITAITHS